MRTVKFIDKDTGKEYTLEQRNELLEQQAIIDISCVVEEVEIKDSAEKDIVETHYFRYLTSEEKTAQANAKHNVEIYEKITHLKTYLNTDWRWRMERFNAETVEMGMGLRTHTTEKLETLIQDRKKAVDEINKLEEQINE